MVKPHQRPEFSPSQHAGSQSPSARTREGMGDGCEQGFFGPQGSPRCRVCACVSKTSRQRSGGEEAFPLQRDLFFPVHSHPYLSSGMCKTLHSMGDMAHPRRCHGHPKPSAAKRRHWMKTLIPSSHEFSGETFDGSGGLCLECKPRTGNGLALFFCQLQYYPLMTRSYPP